MFVVKSPFLPNKEEVTANKYSAQAVKLKTAGQHFARLTRFNFKADKKNIIDNIIENQEIPMPPETATVCAVIVGGQTLTPAINPSSPQTGEFVYNPYNNTIKIASNQKSAIVISSNKKILIAPSPVHGYPSFFANLPLNAGIEITRTFEQHPTAQIGFSTPYSKAYVESVFKPGMMTEMFGIPLRIGSISVNEESRVLNPDGQTEVSISFSGKWENFVGEPCFLRKDGSNTLENNTPFQDEECTNPDSYEKDFNNSIDISELLRRIGIPYHGIALKRVPIPPNTARDAVINPGNAIEERLRLAQCFALWSDASGLRTVRYDSSNAHTILESEIIGEIQTSYNAICKNSKNSLIVPNFNYSSYNYNDFLTTQYSPSPFLMGETATNLSFEYANVELTGKFKEKNEEKKESTAGKKPRYVRREVERKERIEGNKEAYVPLEGVNSLKTMSLCFDLGGQTKNRTIVTEEDGAVIRTIDQTYGFVYTGEDIWNQAAVPPKLSGTAYQYWKLIREVTTYYNYDEKTGYLISKIGRGFNTVRWVKESADKPETLKYYGISEPIADKKRKLYQFFTIPITERHSRSLRIMPEYSSDGLFEIIKVCNRDGTASYEPLINPDYAPEYYIEREITETVAFARRSNPKNEGKTVAPGIKFEPDLIVGEESYYASSVQDITPAKYEMKIVGSENGKAIYQRGEIIAPQKFYKHTVTFRAEGEAIATAREEVKVEEGTGNPPTADRRPPRYKKEEMQVKEEPSKTEVQYKYLIWTEGYNAQSPISGSESFELAETYQEAYNAAKCKLTIENWRNAYSETIEVPFKPQIKEGDKLFYFCNGQYRSRIVISVNHSLEVKGNLNGHLVIAGTTKLSLGKHTIPQLYSDKIKLPATKNKDKYNISVLNTVNEQLNGGFAWNQITSRRNF